MTRKSSIPDWPHRWDLLLRYRLIEIIALWEGRITTRSLIDAFGIGRQQASKDINEYNRIIAPDNLYYDKSLKGYRPAANFVPVVTKGDINEYLHLLNSKKDLMLNFEYLNIHQAHTEMIKPLIRQVKPAFVRPIIQASRENKRVEIQYVSLSNPNPEDRMIAPHTLIFTGYRWHVRAYCEKTAMFKDFLLSRMTDISEITLKSSFSEKDDDSWNTIINIIITPDPRLNPQQKIVIENDYGMENGQLLIKSRAALVSYYLQLLRIDREQQLQPEAQQIIVKNKEQLQPWLFSG